MFSFLEYLVFFGAVCFTEQVAIAFGILILHDGRFSKCSHFSSIWCFLERFVSQNKCK